MRRLDERELRIARTGWHVDDQKISSWPQFDIAEELGDDFHDDRSAPDCRRIALDQKPDRNELYSVRLKGDDLRIRIYLKRLVDGSDHPRNVRAVDIRIHEPHPCARLASDTARLTATVDFPTPPFPLDTAMTVPRFG